MLIYWIFVSTLHPSKLSFDCELSNQLKIPYEGV